MAKLDPLKSSLDGRSSPHLGSGESKLLRGMHTVPPQGKQHYWPGKSRGMDRSGCSRVRGPDNLDSPAWILDVPHASPKVADRELFWSKCFLAGVSECLAGCLGGCFAGMFTIVAGSPPAGSLAISATLLCVGAATLAFCKRVAPEMPMACSRQHYASPVIDGKGNIYTLETSGTLVALRPNGSQIWRTKIGEVFPIGGTGQHPTPALLDDYLYLADGMGAAMKLSLDSGEELWRTKYAFSSGNDSWCVAASDGVVIVIGFPTKEMCQKDDYSGSHITALDVLDGSVKWTTDIVLPDGTRRCPYKFMPAIGADTMWFSDKHGNTYCYNLSTGEQLWARPVPKEDQGSVSGGGVALAPNGFLYVTSNIENAWPFKVGKGKLAAIDAQSGKERWSRTFDCPYEANAAPTVYKAGPGRIAVCTGLGPSCGWPWPMYIIVPKPIMNAGCNPGQFLSVDAETGETLWTFDAPTWNHHGCRGSSMYDMMLTDAWSNAAVGCDGRIYVGWHGGVAYQIDGATGKELSKCDLGSAFQGCPAIAPAMVVFAAGKRVVAFV